MRQNRFKTLKTSTGRDAGLGRNLLVSLGLHLVVVALFTGVLLPRMREDRRPVYYVDLVNLPVADPQAGRPDAPATKPEAKPKAREEAQKVPPKAPPKPAPQAEVEKIPPKKPKPQPQPKPEPKSVETPPVKEQAAKPQPDYREALSAIEQMKRKREIEALKERLAALAERDPRAASEAPVGMPEGRGAEAGVGWELWIRSFLKSNWSLSKYQVSRLDLEATVRIVYDAAGNLVNYEFMEKSGDPNFDRSVKEAIFKEKKLPRKPGERMEIEVAFNLKDLME